MILIENDYSSKYWLTEDIKDCGKSNEIKLTINTEKLKEKGNNYNNHKKANGSYYSKNTKSNNPNRNKYNIQNTNKHQTNRYENKSPRTINSKKTNKHLTVSRNNYSNNYQKKMSQLSSSSPISEYNRKHIMLDSCTRPSIKDI